METVQTVNLQEGQSPLDFYSRSADKIHFYLNASLATVSLSKAAIYIKPEKAEEPFSLADIKTLYANELLLDQFISMFKMIPNISEINLLRDLVTNFGRSTA